MQPNLSRTEPKSERFYRQVDKFVQKIEKAINGQYSAIQCYAKLANMAPTKKEKAKILEIRSDEVRHYQRFTQLYIHLTGKQPSLKKPEECPNTYVEGLKYALEDEQNTVDFYLDIMEKSMDPYIKEVFRRAAADEQNHAVWFLYFLVTNKG
ncbi:ferritin-like domain-containing protein [Bacillus smithii]|uniref:ferritin-like domain-containing protein n=1 Tax=Bacillus smithii TaxID=1479 RepID=UPI0022E3125E|nr:ferritin-like domain-containing protein [Bacillus smithii]